MTRWFAADMHFSHANIIDYCNRPFENPSAMNEAIITLWNESVHPQDIVEVEGDVALGKISESLPLVGRLNGHLFLRPGNHDRCSPIYGSKGAKWVSAYLEAGFEGILHPQGPISIGRYTVIACHFPYSGDSKDADRFTGYRPVDRGSWLIHGHVHDTWRQRGRQINVGIDAWGGTPVSEEILVELIEAGVRDLAPLPWPRRDAV
jgi:calcineurin-like phosphoesterase family protein